MLESELSYRLQVHDSPDGTASVVELKDQFLNYAFADQLKGAIKEATSVRTERGVRRFVVDLTAVNVMDSCGLSVLIGMKKIVDMAGGRLVVVAPSPIIRRLFAITRLDRVFQLAQTLDEARVLFDSPAPTTGRI